MAVDRISPPGVLGAFTDKMAAVVLKMGEQVQPLHADKTTSS